MGGGDRIVSGWWCWCPALEECMHSERSICRGTDVAVVLAEGAITLPSSFPTPRVKWVGDVK